MSPPLVTCVMLCTWPRRAAMLDDALKSYDAQTHANRELVVVNDGAPLRSLRGDVRVANVAPATIGAKRNAGLAAARGDYVATWDDDDVSLPDRLARLVALCEASGAAWARLKALWIADEDLAIRGLLPGEHYGTAVFRADALRRCAGWPDVDLLEDMELSFRLALRGLRCAYDDAPRYVCRRHGGNVTAGRTSLAASLARALPQRAAEVPAAQAALDAVRARPAPALLESA